MEIYLITGFGGFVSNHFLNYLDTLNTPIKVVGISRKIRNELLTYKNLNIQIELADLTNRLRIQDILAHYRPNFILHLASDSSVAYSWKYPIDSFQNNTNIFLNLLESVRILQIPCRILSIGSSEEYGIVAKENLPIHENTPLNPISPYAVARVSQELLSKVYVEGYNLDIIMTRSFNHIGAGQDDKFVIPSFVKQIITNPEKKLQVGNLQIVRDFLDVQDVVRAYVSLLQQGKKGEIYNVCSGKGVTLLEILETIAAMENINLQYWVDKNLIRPNDNPAIIGDYTKIYNSLGWKPTVPLQQSLTEIRNFFRNNIT